MEQYAIDALLLTAEENLTYFSGVRAILPDISKTRTYLSHLLLLQRSIDLLDSKSPSNKVKKLIARAYIQDLQE